MARIALSPAGSRESMPLVVAGTASRSDTLGRTRVVLPVLDLAVKLVLVGFLVRLALDPAWGNLEGKAPLARAIIYPCLGVAVPALYAVRGRRQPFPWGADVLVTFAGFSDILGNRLDLYDRVDWFDDWIHFVNTGFIAAAALLMSTPRRAPVGVLVDRALAVGLSVALGWELWEYYAFVTRTGESATAYADTLVDLSLGWAGALTAAAVIAVMRADRQRSPHHLTEGTEQWHTR